MHYMPADSEATAALISFAIYHLSQCLDMASNVTQYAFGWLAALDGSIWMQWDPTMVIPVHAERSDELLQLLTGFVLSGHLTQESADDVLALAASREGSTVTLAEVTPPEWEALMLTEEEAEPLWPPATP